MSGTITIGNESFTFLRQTRDRAEFAYSGPVKFLIHDLPGGKKRVTMAIANGTFRALGWVHGQKIGIGFSSNGKSGIAKPAERGWNVRQNGHGSANMSISGSMVEKIPGGMLKQGITLEQEVRGDSLIFRIPTGE